MNNYYPPGSSILNPPASLNPGRSIDPTSAE
jgi:hypothetical protein